MEDLYLEIEEIIEEVVGKYFKYDSERNELEYHGIYITNFGIEFDSRYGFLPFFSGEVHIHLNFFKNEKKLKTFNDAYEIFENQFLEEYTEIGSSYIEFLYPGSEDYGYHLHMPFLDSIPKEYFYMDCKKRNKYHIYRTYLKLLEKYNNALGEIEDKILKIRDELAAELAELYEDQENQEYKEM